MAFSGTTPNETPDLNAVAIEELEQRARSKRIGDDPRPVLVLLSGGQDSTTCLFWARREFPNSPVYALTAHYGQRHQAEVGAAAHIAGLAGVSGHDVVDLAPVLAGAESALVRPGLDIEASGGFRDVEAPGGLPTSFVPGRNLVFLAVAAAYAARRRCQAIVLGVCQTDYSGYPDCRLDFVRSMTAAIRSSLPTELQDIEVYTPLLNATKADTVRLMSDLAKEDGNAWMALQMSVTCYHGRSPGCGACPACLLRAKGFFEAGVEDPANPNGLPPPRALAPVTGVPVKPRGDAGMSLYERDRAEKSKRAAAEVAAFDRPDDVLADELVRTHNGALTYPEMSIRVVTRGDAIELRSAPDSYGNVRPFSLTQAAAALEHLGYKAHFDALDLRADLVRPDRNVVVEVGSRTIELSESELQDLADASVKATEPPFEYERTDEAAWQVKRSGDVTYDDLGSMVPEHTMGTGKPE